MQFIDLAAQQKRIRNELETAVKTVMDHGRYIMGPEVKELEERLADYAGTRYAVGCASGTDALLMVLMAYKIGPGDAVFTTPFTFVATAEVISLLGATPVFVDIDPITFNIDPQKLEEAIRTSVQALNPRGIIGVDLFGLPAEYDEINKIAEKFNLFVVEDAAQSFGAEYRGKKACALANAACTSFFPAKPLGCYGDGGAVFTDDPDIAERLISIRVHGQGREGEKYKNVRIGVNGRLDTIQAAVLNVKMTIFPDEVERRIRAASIYSAGLSGCDYLTTPSTPDGLTSVWAQYSILADTPERRDQILQALKDNAIPTSIYYPIPLHLQKAFSNLGHKPGAFPISEDYAERIFSIPMHPYLDEKAQTKIIEILASVQK